jgi:hypothetical protein
MIERLINGMFREGQAEYILGNLSIWVRDYYERDYAPRPTMVFAGPKNRFAPTERFQPHFLAFIVGPC